MAVNAARTNNPQLVENCAEITPSDTVDIDVTSGIRVNVTGNVQMIFWGGATVTLLLVGGIDYPYRVTRVYATDTTATGIYRLD